MGTPVVGGNAHSNTSTENIKTPAATHQQKIKTPTVNTSTGNKCREYSCYNSAGIDDSM
jgi:hypothetical protein